MPKTVAIHDLDEWDEYLDELDRSGRRPSKAPKGARNGPAESPASMVAAIESGFNPSFRGSRHERDWILTYLGPFYRDELISDVLHVVKGGKEATVYCCRAHPSTGLDLIAAKVYRPKQFRTFKNDADYKWGRPLLASEGGAIRDRRLLKAVSQGSRAGEAASHTSWLAHEYLTMTLLHERGADVPRPVAQDENAILMEYVGDVGAPAPALNDVHVDRELARHLFERLLQNIELMLSNDRIHGDLSAYNILFWDERAVIIDFPQVIDAYGNPNAFRFLLRDVERTCQYFHRHGLHSDPLRIARVMWDRAMPDETYQVRGAHTKW
jgi:RIO kinase 1